jgi:hypothetical protein
VKVVFNILVFIGLVLTMFQCANQQGPSGGPPDKTPPRIVETYPKPGTTHFHDNRLNFSFSKYIQRRSLQESFFISPSLGVLSFDWSGKDVEVTFSDSLKPNTTYIVTLGTDLVDRRGNRLVEAFSLPFSTGDKFDSCSIAGIVMDDKPVGVMVYAYQLNGENPDTLNPTHSEPNFLTQTGKDGTFLLSYLPYGTFRLIAVRDEFKNLLYDVQTDQYGTTPSDIALTREAPAMKGIQFKLTKEDTATPFISSAKFLDRRHIVLRLSEPVDISTAIAGNVSITDSNTQTPVKVIDLSFGLPPYNEAQLVTDSLTDKKIYLVKLHGFKDLSGNAMSMPTDKTEFTAGATPDTTLPSLEIKYPPSAAREVMIDDTIHIIFSEAVNARSFENGFMLKDSLAQKVAGALHWFRSRELFFIPQAPFVFGMAYTLTMRLDSMIDFSGNRGKDSTLTWKFSSVEERSLSSISGTIIDEMKDGRGKTFITASNLTRKGARAKTVCIDSTGVFIIDQLFDGRYTLSAFRDADGNGTYTFGKPVPFEPAERFVNYPDTLKLRPRWPLEGVSIRLK